MVKFALASNRLFAKSRGSESADWSLSLRVVERSVNTYILTVGFVAFFLATACLAQGKSPGFLKHQDQIDLLTKGVAQAELLRQQFLTPAVQHETFDRISSLNRLIRSFAGSSISPLRKLDRRTTEGFRSVELLPAIRGVEGKTLNSVFKAFQGKWYGLWDGQLVDHHWHAQIECGTPFAVALRDDKQATFVYVHSGQYAWIGDGFGWNLVCSRTPNGPRYILGVVYHVQDGDRHRIKSFRPHIGVSLDARRLIWITADNFYLEEAYLDGAAEGDRYAITGSDIQWVNRAGIAGFQGKGDAFQAIYSRDPSRRPEFRRFQVKTAGQ